MGYDQYTVSDDCTCRIYFCCFPLALAKHFHGLSCQFFQISLKNSELKTTHNAFQDCRVHFFDNLSWNICIHRVTPTLLQNRVLPNQPLKSKIKPLSKLIFKNHTFYYKCCEVQNNNPSVEWMFEINEEVQPKKEIRDKKSLSAGNGIFNNIETLLELLFGCVIKNGFF